MFVEEVLTARIGEAGKRLHTARSRNDQVAVDLKLWLRGAIKETASLLIALTETVNAAAKEHAATIMPGYTHLQRAQPITFGHHLCAYGQMFLRDLDRLADARRRTSLSPLGSGALAGTTYPIDRHMTALALDFEGPTENSVVGVSDRDHAVELVSTLSILMMHLSRFAEEIILWCSSEFSFIELDDAYSTGSSIMPQKKNPDMAELVRGKTGRVYGDLISLLTLMKGLPLAYNKDMQEDKQAVFDAVDTVKMCLGIFAPMIRTMTVKTGRMREAASGGFINATDCADYLVKKGLAFRDAYKIVGELVGLCLSEGATLETLPLKTYREICPTFDEDVYEAIDLSVCLNRRGSFGGPAPESVLRQTERIDLALKEYRKQFA
jgi:argininosuccinate lyase